MLNETRREEALATLQDEGVISESYFLESTPEGDYLIAYMKAESFEKSSQVFKKSAHDIDRYHQKFKEDTWEKVTKLEMLVDLDRIKRK